MNCSNESGNLEKLQGIKRMGNHFVKTFFSRKGNALKMIRFKNEKLMLEMKLRYWVLYL